MQCRRYPMVAELVEMVEFIHCSSYSTPVSRATSLSKDEMTCTSAVFLQLLAKSRQPLVFPHG